MVVRLNDIVEAIFHVQSELEGLSLRMFEADRRKRWIVERGIEIVSEASRHLSEALKARHPEIPWRKVAGIGNVLRHEYQRTAYDILWHVVRDELPPLEKVCRAELDALGGGAATA